MSEFLSGLITGIFATVGFALALFAYAAVVVGSWADRQALDNQYDPEK